MSAQPLSQLLPTQIAGMDRLPILKQDDITKRFGKPLVPSKVYYLLRDATANFTQPGSETAQQLSAALYSLLQNKGMFSSSSANPAPAPTPAKAPAKAKGKTDNANPIGEAIEALQVALEFSDPSTSQQIREAIEALQVAMEFA